MTSSDWSDGQGPSPREAREIAILHLSRFRTSSGRVLAHLAARGVDTSIARQVVLDLVADGWISDEQVARRIIAARQGRQAESRSRLRDRLKEQGIPGSVADRVLEDLPNDLDQARAALEGKFGKDLERYLDAGGTGLAGQSDTGDDGPGADATGEGPNFLLARCLRFLASRGFSPELSLAAVSRWLRETGNKEAGEGGEPD